MNVTDVGHMTDDADAGEDKIEKTARAEHKSPREIADYYLGLFLRDMDLLKIQRPEVLSRATDHIAEMIALTERIIEHGYAYPTAERRLLRCREMARARAGWDVCRARALMSRRRRSASSIRRTRRARTTSRYGCSPSPAI